jgi:hypothetical protein
VREGVREEGVRLEATGARKMDKRKWNDGVLE